MAGPDLDRAGDGLYALPLEEFVSARNELAKRLKKDGDADAAAEVASRRKPTLVAWAVDQVAHTRRREVDLLLDAGKRLVAAQQASISKGSRSELDAAQVSLRKSVASLTDAAGKILGTRASTSTLARVAETLRAAATVAEGRELLARGCLVEELSDTGWDLVAALTPAPQRGRRPQRRAQPQAEPTPEPTEKETKAERARRTARVAELERARAAAEKRVAAARRKEEAAAVRLADAEAARRAAEDELAEVAREIAETEGPD
jgi:hypothetical protein